MNGKRITIYDLAKELNISVSYISKALNNHPSISTSMKEKVRKKADELKYTHNSQAANLRRGSSKTIGVIVPQINKSFFSEAISGIEEVCQENNHGLLICQSHDSYEQECKAVDTLVRQNVDCILLSISAETHSSEHLQAIRNNNIEIVQFDRYIDSLASFRVLNNDEEITYQVVRHLIQQQYQRIAFISGPEHLAHYRSRKAGFLRAMNDAGLPVPVHFIVDDALAKEKTMGIASQLLDMAEPPDAFITVADHQALEIFQLAHSLGLDIPDQVGLVGFANEDFTAIVTPPLSSVDQKSKELGRQAVSLYFETLVDKNEDLLTKQKKEVIVDAELIIRKSSMRFSGNLPS